MINAQRCPLCGEPNHCVMADPDSNKDSSKQGHCWCVSKTFSKVVLDRIPVEAKRRACICRHCVEKGAE